MAKEYLITLTDEEYLALRAAFSFALACCEPPIEYHATMMQMMADKLQEPKVDALPIADERIRRAREKE